MSILPAHDSIEEAPIEVMVSWSEDMVASTLRVSINNDEITDELTRSADRATGEMNPLPGRKLLSAQVKDSVGIPYGATSIFTVTSTLPRAGFAGGRLGFQCESNFLTSFIPLPGVDLDLGLSQAICQLFPIIGIFPPGDSGFPVGPRLPVLHGVIPQQVTFDVDDRIPNGISFSPVEWGLVLDVDPADPKNAGEVHELSFVMEGTILPAPGPGARRDSLGDGPGAERIISFSCI